METPNSPPDFARYESKGRTTGRRVLMISEVNTIPFLEKTFCNHPDYIVINESLEAILAMGVQNYIASVVDDIRNRRYDFDGIAGFFNTPNALACVLSHLTGKTAPPLASVIRCQSKFEARRLQAECVPEWTPCFSDHQNALRPQASMFPRFAKPVRAARSFSSARVTGVEALERLIGTNYAMLQKHNQPYIEAVRTATQDVDLLSVVEASNDFVCEDVLSGEQYAIDGYVYQGQVFYHGIVKEVFLPNSISFERHEFPADIAPDWVVRLKDMTERLIRHTGLNNTEFDIELMIDFDTNQGRIIEMNPYAVSQYENLFTLAGGDQMLVAICALACGVPPPAKTQPRYKYCYSCELRTYEDQLIEAVPTPDDIARIEAEFPDVRIVNRIPPAVRKLSDFRQTEDTFRYCIVSIPGNSRPEIMGKLEAIKARLDYRFRPILDEAMV